MPIISALDLRNNLGEILSTLSQSDEEFILKYRGKIVGKLVSTKTSNSKKTKGQQVIDFFDSVEYNRELAKRTTNPLYNQDNPRQEKLNFRARKVI